MYIEKKVKVTKTEIERIELKPGDVIEWNSSGEQIRFVILRIEKYTDKLTGLAFYDNRANCYNRTPHIVYFNQNSSSEFTLLKDDDWDKLT